MEIKYFVLVLQATMAEFYKIAGMPRVIGAVDGSLIPIRAPHDQEHLYVCHKGFHVINTMAVCNAQLLFTNFVCRWHGRFRCLDVSGGALQFEPSRCCTIITATAVLHNMCIFDNTPLPGYDEPPPHEPDLVNEVPAHLQSNAGVLARDRLINGFKKQLPAIFLRDLFHVCIINK